MIISKIRELNTHGEVISREYRIPAITAAKGATNLHYFKNDIK
jgi:hypothetical protein